MKLTQSTIEQAAARGFKIAVQVPDGRGGYELFGVAEHVTADGWVGIRQPQAGNRLDEYPLSRVEIDPT